MRLVDPRQPRASLLLVGVAASMLSTCTIGEVERGDQPLKTLTSTVVAAALK